MGFDSVSRTHVGLRRSVNEDAVLERPDAGLWVVADGMGGHSAGDVASAMVVKALGELSAAGSLEERSEAIVEALGEVNDALIDLGHSDFRPRTIGTTVVGVVIDDARYTCFWAGDSRAYLVRGGEIHRLTRDHSLVQDLMEAGLLRPDELEGHPDANVITRAVGASRELKVDRVSGDLAPGDMFLIASDGLTRMVKDHELEAELTRRPPPAAAERLIETVLRRGAPDNVSLVIACGK